MKIPALPDGLLGPFFVALAIKRWGMLSGFWGRMAVESIRKGSMMAQSVKLFTLEEAAEYALRADREVTIEDVGEENRDLCWRFSRAFGEAMTRFLMTRVRQTVFIVDGSYWVIALGKGDRRPGRPVVSIGTSIVRTRDHNIAVTLD